MIGLVALVGVVRLFGFGSVCLVSLVGLLGPVSLVGFIVWVGLLGCFG